MTAPLMQINPRPDEITSVGPGRDRGKAEKVPALQGADLQELHQLLQATLLRSPSVERRPPVPASGKKRGGQPWPSSPGPSARTSRAAPARVRGATRTAVPAGPPGRARRDRRRAARRGACRETRPCPPSPVGRTPGRGRRAYPRWLAPARRVRLAKPPHQQVTYESWTPGQSRGLRGAGLKAWTSGVDIP